MFFFPDSFPCIFRQLVLEGFSSFLINSDTAKIRHDLQQPYFSFNVNCKKAFESLVSRKTDGAFVCKPTNSCFCNFHKAFSAKEKWLQFFNTGFYYWRISMASFTLQRLSQFSSQKHSCQSKIRLRCTGFHSTVTLSKLALYQLALPGWFLLLIYQAWYCLLQSVIIKRLW